MTKHDEIESGLCCFYATRRGKQAAPTVARGVASARVRAVVRKRRREIWMQPAKRSNREWISEHAADHAIALVLGGSQAVTVFDVRAPGTDFASPRSEHVIHADIATKHVAAPAVMISRNHGHLNAGVDDVSQCSERSKPAARNYRSPLEPELEQIAVDDERAAIRRDVAQERNHRPFHFTRRETEVCVREDVARRVEHARILPATFALYKRRRPNELGRVPTDSPTDSTAPLCHDVEFRVRYAETDQMGVVYHANYLIWCEVGRTDFIRARGMSYADMERAGVGLAVSELTARFHSAAKYDDMIRVRTTLAEVRSRGITFDYLITRLADGHRLVSARTALVSIDGSGRPIALPASVRSLFDRAL
jgi:acyl-CoA thioester hydrolase